MRDRLEAGASRLRRGVWARALGASFALLWLSALSCDDGFMDWGQAWSAKLGYLHYATETPLAPGSLLNVLNHLERADRDPAFSVPDDSVPADAWDPIFDKLWRLRDTSDFDLLYLLNLLYAHGGKPAVPQSLWDAADQAVLDFKYWYTDPTPVRIVDGLQVVDQMWYWTENHVLLFRTNEYLAGRRHPAATFSVTGLTGAQHEARARPEILRWLDERARWGFSEWHSDVYYQKDLTPLLSLVEWGDAEIAARAAMVLDLLLLDIALHLHDGNFGATHGRSYIKDKPTATRQDSYNGTKLLFDDTSLPYTSRGAPDASLLARSRLYRLPKVIRRIARSDDVLIDRERMNLFLDEVPDPDPLVPPPPAPFGLDFDDEANLPFWWSMNTQTLWQMTRLTLTVGERENLWEAQFADFKDLRDLVWVEGDIEATLAAARPFLVLLWPALNQSLLMEVNTYTYRTPDYMLSTAQDYRKGLRGAQTHISQATLGENAVVFTQHPSYLPVAAGDPVPPDWNWQQQDEPGPGYWSGNASEPRSAQHENVVIQIYAPQYGGLEFLGFSYRLETHAYVPHAHFDEVVQSGPWTFARKGDAYVALFSHLPTEWRTGQPEVFENAGLPFDLVAPGGAQNVWILECGSASQWGSFAAFQSAISASAIVITPLADADGNAQPDGFDVSYDSPSQGAMSFGWYAPLVVDGVEIPIANYDRFDNPYLQVDFDSDLYEISDGVYGLTLDFATGQRTVTTP